MATKDREERKPKPEKVEVKRSSIKTKDFILKQPLNDKKPGDKVALGVIGEKFYKSKNII